MKKYFINDYVKVKLTSHGINVLKIEHALKEGGEFIPPETDEDGCSAWKLSELMYRLGGECCDGHPAPFDAGIVFFT